MLSPLASPFLSSFFENSGIVEIFGTVAVGKSAFTAHFMVLLVTQAIKESEIHGARSI